MQFIHGVSARSCAAREASMTTRREFVQRSVTAGAVLASLPLRRERGEDIACGAGGLYEKLGVQKIINAAGTTRT